MKSSAKSLLFVVCLFLLALALLTVVGVHLGSDVDTFVPDLIVGVVGAGAITSLIALIQVRSDARRAERADVEAAYHRVLDTMATLRQFSPTGSTALSIGELAMRLTMLGELVDKEYPSIRKWFEAERQYSLFQANRTSEQMEALAPDATVDAQVDALAPFLTWVSEFTSNLLYWRSDRLQDSQMLEQAQRIETMLRAKHAWRDKAMPWRPDSPDVTSL